MMPKQFFMIPVLFCLCLCFPSQCAGAVEVEQTGVASPQSEEEEIDIETLRNRAIRNAIDLAVMRVSGVSVSTERGDSIRSREDAIVIDGKQEQKLKQQSRFRTAATSRTEGHARLVEILREWQENGNYYVKAKISVESSEEVSMRKNAGYYWRRAGKPSISLMVEEEFNGGKHSGRDLRTLRFFRDNLERNGIAVSSVENPNSQYLIKVAKIVKSRQMAEFETVTIHCRLSFQIIDRKRGESIADHRASHGPEAGFSVEQAEERCIKAIASQVSENLVRKIAEIMNDRLQNGVDYIVTIFSIPAGFVTKASDIIGNLYRVTSAEPARYTDKTFYRKLKFKGSPANLAKSIQIAFEDEDWKIDVALIREHEIRFNWAFK